MFSYVRGTVQANLAGELSVMPEGTGFGLAVQVVHGADYPVGSTTTLYLYTHWNQEQGAALYGFNDLLTKQVFKLVLSCPGVGPKLGLAILAQLTPSQFINAINQNDLTLLSSVSGIGQKKAEQLVILLRTKTQKLLLSGDLAVGQAPGAMGYGRRLTDTLTALNYGPYEVAQAVQYVTQQGNSQSELQFEGALRLALAWLAKSA